MKSSILQRRKKSRAPEPRRGRPPKSDVERGTDSDRLLQAAEAVYAQGGEAAFTVDRVIAEANISRPTFYRWFDSRETVLRQLVERANTRLTGAVMAVVGVPGSPAKTLERGIEAYVAWGLTQGAVISALYRDLHQPGTVAGRARQMTLKQVIGLVQAVARADGTHPSPIFIEAMLTAIEHIGSRLFAMSGPDEKTISEHRQAMLDVLRGAIVVVRNQSG